MMSQNKLFPVVMAGGSGSRLWPLSRVLYPKQFLCLKGDLTMLQTTICRLNGVECESPVVICNEQHRFIVAEQLRQLNKLTENIILEPAGRNTAPAIALAALAAKRSSPDCDPLMLVLAADHVIQQEEAFRNAVRAAIPYAESGKLVTETPEGADYQIPVNGGEQNSDLKYMGNMNSKWNMGWNNTFRYKDLTLSMLIDFRIGGKVVSMTEATLDGYGVSERTGRARDRGYVMREGIKFSNVKAYYDVVGATSFNSVYNVEDYVYDATNVRMREISLGYTFRNLFGQSKNLTLAFIARNLFFFYKDAPMDPDVSMGTGNGLQGFDVFNLPTTRSFGLNVKLNF